MSKVVIMRRAVLMEDEGREGYIRTCDKEEADQWIAAQENEYFKPGDYYTIPVPPPSEPFIKDSSAEAWGYVAIVGMVAVVLFFWWLGP